MKERLRRFAQGEIISFLFYIILGLCLILVPTYMVNVICKILFGVVLMGVGGYNIYRYAGEKTSTTILDLFSGVIVFVLGAFLFFNPQVVVKLLPFLLGAFILVDSIWTLRGAFRLYKRSRREWKLLLIGGLVFIALAVVLIINPFVKVTHTVIFAGWVFLCNGAADMVLYFFLKHGMKKADEAVQVVEATVEEEPSQIVDKSGRGAHAPEPENQRDAEPAEEFIIDAEPAEESIVDAELTEESIVDTEPAEESVVHEESATETTVHEEPAEESAVDAEPTEEAAVHTEPEKMPLPEVSETEIPGASVWGLDDDDEVLEEWKDE